MAYSGTKIETWNRSTPRDGLLLDSEFSQLYDDIENYISGNGGGAPPKTMKAMSDLLDATVNVTGNQTIAGVKTFSSAIVSDVTGDVTGNVTGDVTGNVTGDVTGNADTATQADGIKETGAGAAVIHKKIIEIGDWNMDSTLEVTIPHGLTVAKIRHLSVTILDDFSRPRDLVSSGYWYCDSTNITLSRTVSGLFDGESYNSTSYNRGWITIEYVD